MPACRPARPGSAIVLLLVAAAEFPELLFAGPPGLVGPGGAAGAGGLGRLGAVAARRRPLQEVLGDGALQVFHGGRGGHADHPGVLQRLAGRQTLAGVHRQHPLDEVLGQVGHAGPGLGSGRAGDGGGLRQWFPALVLRDPLSCMF